MRPTLAVLALWLTCATMPAGGDDRAIKSAFTRQNDPPKREATCVSRRQADGSVRTVCD